MSHRVRFAFLVSVVSLCAPALAQSVAPNDNLNAVLWAQTSVEAQANATAIYTLAKIRLDQALADPKWTAAPVEQTGDFGSFPPAVILDVDDTLINTSPYQALNVKNGTGFSPSTWTSYVKSKSDAPIPGAVDFADYAVSKGVKVFYVTNRTKEEKPSTVEEMTVLGFPMGATSTRSWRHASSPIGPL